MNSIYNMKLFDRISLFDLTKDQKNSYKSLFRIPGGWLMEHWENNCYITDWFIPFNNEFQVVDK
jgi:hypothetical protein